MLVGPGSVVVALLLGLDPIRSTLLVGFSFGGTVALVILLLGRYSAQINPAVTLAHCVGRLTRRRLFVPYLCFQVLGALTAGFTLSGLFGPLHSSISLGSTKLAGGMSPLAGVVLETVGTFALAMAALVASGRIRSRVVQALFVGGTLFALIQLIGPLTGAGFNPARSLGPAIASGYLVDQYVYWVGPLLGGALAGLVFAMVSTNGGAKRKLGIVCMCA